MKKILSFTASVALFGGMILNTGCVVKMQQGSLQPNVVNWNKGDYELSDIKTAKGVAKLFLGFSTGENDKSGSVSIYGEGGVALPTGCCLAGMADPTAGAKSVALYNLMEQNPGYDGVVSPNYKIEQRTPCGIPLIQTTEVTVSARLIKYKK
jgi:hypothetical protein